MSQLIHAVSRVRAMESQLLSQNAVNRMIAADSFDSAYSVLDDLGYAEESSYFRDTKNFEGVLEVGLYASAKIFKSFGLGEEFKILTLTSDIQNTLLFLKSFDKGEDGTAIEKDMISYGYYPLDQLRNAIFNQSGPADILKMISQAKACETLSLRHAFIKNKFFTNAHIQVSKAKEKVFLNNFLLRIEHAEEIKKNILSFEKEDLLKKYPLFSDIITDVFKYSEVSEKITALQVLLDESMVAFLKKESLGKIDGIAPLFSFFWRKERNARVIRSILIAKKAGISPEEIKSEFSSFIF